MDSELFPDLPPDVRQRALALLSRRFSLLDPQSPYTPALVALAAARLDPAALSGEPRPAPALPPEAGLLGRRASDFRSTRRPVKDINPPPMPTVFMELKRITGDHHSSLGDIAKVIARDPGLATSVLRLANSGFYSFMTRVDTISRAVSLIGVQQIGMLALGASVLSLFRDVPEASVLDIRLFWRHSLACAVLDALLAERLARKKEQERAFVAGLLHDIGRVLLCTSEPVLAGEARLRARGSGRDPLAVEREVLGFTHAELSGVMAVKWKFPDNLTEALRGHHEPMAMASPLEPAMTHLADVMANALGYGTYEDAPVPVPDPAAWALLGLTPEDLPALAEVMDERLAEVLTLFGHA